MPTGPGVELFTMSRGPGLQIRVITLGGIIESIEAPDRHGRPGNVVLGCESLRDYLAQQSYLGALVGRCANRIAEGRVTLDGVTHQLTCNDGPHHLHGGTEGFDRRVWDAQVVAGGSGDEVLELSLVSEHGDQGYPGTLRAKAVYSLQGDDTLRIDYEARTDAATLVNLTQHSYFNLSAGVCPDILSHELTLPCDFYTPVDAFRIPTGEIAAVAGTPFDFRARRPIGSACEYDHNWVIRRAPGEDRLVLAARLDEPGSGRSLEVRTTEPGLQFYGGNLLARRHHALCLETQHYPDAPHHPHFPSIVLRPGEVYRSATTYRFAA